MKDQYCVSVAGHFGNGKWEGVTEFYYPSLDEAFSFFDNDAYELIPQMYQHLKVDEFEVSIWDDTQDNGEALEVFTVKALGNK